MDKRTFSLVVEVFLDDLRLRCSRQSNGSLSSLNNFPVEAWQAATLIRKRDATLSDLLAGAFGIVDEFVGDTWDQVIHDTYDSFLTQRRVQHDDSSDA
jgi:hypothetical protein